jgi:hypothetical protein
LKKGDEQDAFPQFVLCSSAGVTRPGWSEEKKKKFVGAADIPIVRSAVCVLLKLMVLISYNIVD